MNAVTKKLLLEIISFLNTRKFKKEDKYVKKAYEKIGDDIVKSRTEDLLSWINPKNHFLYNSLDMMIIYEEHMSRAVFEEVYGEFKLLFEHIPELKEIFVLKEEHVEFKSSLSKKDIQEIYDFVETNYIIDPRRITRYIRPSKE
jgi:hypothetical protein